MLPSIAVRPPRKGNFVALLLVISYAQPHSKNSDKALKNLLELLKEYSNALQGLNLLN